MFTEDLLRRFTKDYKIPIKLYIEPYFTERLTLYDKIFPIIDKLELFKQELSKYNTEEDYFAYYTKVKESIMKDIKNNSIFQKFNNIDMSAYTIPVEFRQLPSKDIYHHSNLGKRFISVDMKKANFSSLRHYNPEIFSNKITWEDYMRKFTNSEYIINSKYIREVIMGNCNPKRQVTYEKYLMGTLLTDILTNDVMHNFPVVFFSNDEIVFDITNCNIENEIVDLINHSIVKLNLNCRIEVFTLKEIIDLNKNNKVLGYIRDFRENLTNNEKKTEDFIGKIDFKKVTHLYMPMIIKYLINMPITDNDLIFEQEDELCKLMITPAISINEV